MLCAIRKAISIPLDCHTDNPQASGGFIRTYEIADIVKITAPVYLKSGNSALSAHGITISKADIHKMIRQITIVLEMVERYAPDAKQSQRKLIGV